EHDTAVYEKGKGIERTGAVVLPEHPAGASSGTRGHLLVLVFGRTNEKRANNAERKEQFRMLLNCPLDRETLNIALQLLDNGANPEALAAVVTELQNEARRVQTGK
ncbi:putative mitotic-spindle organizing protein 1, partial [Paramicrosporidium saccamoebae]